MNSKHPDSLQGSRSQSGGHSILTHDYRTFRKIMGKMFRTEMVITISIHRLFANLVF